MSQSGTIVHRTAGQYIPNDYLDRMLKENPTAWGAVTVSTEEGVKKLQLNSSDEGATVEQIQETMKVFPDQDITFYFCNSASAISTEDISPYVLVCKDVNEDEEEPQVVAFLEGNFPGYAQKDSSHPPERHLVEDILIPKFESMYEMLDGDIEKLMDHLKKPHFKKEMLLTSVSRGIITLVSTEGCITFEQNDLSAEFPWGWVSNTHGYATIAAAKKSMFPGRSTVREKAPSEKIAAAVTPPKTDTSTIKNYTVKKEKPPAHLSRKDKKNWYKMKIGYCPQGWENGIAIDCYVDPTGKVMTMSQVKALGLESVKIQGLAQNPPREKDIEPDNIPVPEADVNDRQPKVTAEILPLVSPKTKEHIHSLLKDEGVQKVISENADIILDPKKVQQIEAKFADFANQIGMKSMDDFMAWSYEMFYNLGKEKPDGLAVMCWTFRNQLAKLRTAEIKQEEKAPEKKPSLYPSRQRSAA